jgi:hypothetical protein
VSFIEGPLALTRPTKNLQMLLKRRDVAIREHMRREGLARFLQNQIQLRWA